MASMNDLSFAKSERIVKRVLNILIDAVIDGKTMCLGVYDMYISNTQC